MNHAVEIEPVGKEFRTQNKWSMRKTSTIVGLGFAVPWLIGFVFLFLWPFAASLYWSFCDFDLVNPPTAVGFENYRRIAGDVWQGRGFGLAVGNTLYYVAFSVPLSIAVGVILASTLSQDIRGQGVFRTIIYLPSVLPVVAVSILWLWIMDPQRGWANWLLEGLGLPPQNWLTQSRSLFSPESLALAASEPLGNWQLAGAKDALILLTLWGVGNYMVIYLAAIKDVPAALYEAAKIDGAGPIRRFWTITLPMLSPVLFFHLVIGLIRGVQTFTSVYVLSEGTGEPGGSLMMISLQLFKSAFADLQVGYASAMAWIVLVILAGITYWLFQSSRHWVHYRVLN
jgi:multiple sugar transport system permease protein